MNEIDDPYRMDRDLTEDLDAQLKRAIERSKQTQEDQEWTPEEQAQLNAELARIPFNPDHTDPNFADREINLQGELVPIHAFNNFPMLLRIFNTLSHSADKPKAISSDAIYAELAAERKYVEIFDKLEQTFPAAYKRSLQIYLKRKEEGGLAISQEEKEYILSQTYSAAAQIALTLDPNYDLSFLRS